MADVQVILTDLGNVVLRVEFLRTAEMLCDLAGVARKSPEVVYDGTQEASDALNEGRWTAWEYYQNVLAKQCPGLSKSQFRQAWMAMLGEDFTQVKAAYHELTVPLFVLSNTNGMHLEGLAGHWLRDYCEQFWASNEIGLRKPHAVCYQYALDRMGVAPEQVLFFDDLAENIDAARELGIQAVQVNNPDIDVPAALRQYGVID